MFRITVSACQNPYTPDDVMTYKFRATNIQWTSRAFRPLGSEARVTFRFAVTIVHTNVLTAEIWPMAAKSEIVAI
jgi:hypothetical protein